MADLSAELVRANLERVRGQIADAGRDPDEVEILAAVKYLAIEQLGVLADAGITLVGENRAQELIRKADAYPGVFTWDFIGALQSRKVRDLLPYGAVIQAAPTTASTSVGSQTTTMNSYSATERPWSVNLMCDWHSSARSTAAG